jgi:hypothetical protein
MIVLQNWLQKFWTNQVNLTPRLSLLQFL